MAIETATFAAGCFWGVESDFRSIPGVLDVKVGYTGGHKDNPTYQQVCSDMTGHAEAALVEFDNEMISYRQLVDAFFKIHNPTQLNRQGPDHGSQYRSAVFYHSEEQRQIATKAIEDHQPNWDREIVTQIVEASTFWPAEEYHQRYFEKNGVAHCRL